MDQFRDLVEPYQEKEDKYKKEIEKMMFDKFHRFCDVHIEREKIDLLVIDVMLAGIDGFEVIRRIRSNPNSSVKRIIVTTGLVNDSIFSFTNTYNIDLMIMKPYNLDSLMIKLEYMSSHDVNRQYQRLVDRNSEESEEILKTRLMNDITSILHEVGIPAHIKGYNYLRSGIEEVFYASSMNGRITKELYPNIAKDWDYSKNIKKPSQVRPMDNRKYWWICPKCGKSYQASPSKRVGRHQGCPDCGRLITIASHFKKVINLETCEIFPSIKVASEKTGIKAGSISNCCRGVCKTAGGYHWKFFKEE